MAVKLDFSSLSLNVLQQRCSVESERFFNKQTNDPRYCYEIFLRAICKRNQAAWNFIFQQYESLVTKWVRQHRLITAVNEEVAYFVNRAFERMWLALTPKRCDHFPNLKSILRYLQMCVGGAIQDYMRQKEQATYRNQIEPEESHDPKDESTLGSDAKIVNDDECRALWAWIEEQLKTDKEYIIIHDSFVLNLKPSNISEAHQGLFKNTKEISRIKDNVLRRLRRNAPPEFRDFFS